MQGFKFHNYDLHHVFRYTHYHQRKSDQLYCDILKYILIDLRRNCYYCYYTSNLTFKTVSLHFNPSTPSAAYICVSESGQNEFRQWLAVYSAPSYYLNICWVIVNWIRRNTLKWKINQNAQIFIHKNASENIVCEMAAMLFRGWVNKQLWTVITHM